MTHRRLALCTISLALAAACDDDRLTDAYYGRMVYDVFPDTARGASQDPSDPNLGYRQFELKAGYVGGEMAEYADLGPLNPVLPNVYILVQNGKAVAGQYPIVDTAPDKGDYSSFWHVVQVEVPGSYEANELKSFHGIERSGYPSKDTKLAMYCPIVNPDAAFFGVDGTVYNVFFGTDEVIPNPSYDPNADGGTEKPTLTEAAATEADIRLKPVWHKRLMGFCFPGMLDAQRGKRYPAIEVKDDAECTSANAPEGGCTMHWELDEGAFAARYDFYQPLEATEGEYVSWELPALFSAGPTADDYSPAVIDFALYTDTPTETASLEGLDLTMAEGLQYLDNPIFRTIPIPEPEPESGEGDPAAMQ